MRIALIVAVAANNVIGSGNALPWHLPEDLRHFKQLTLGKPIVMGRRTYEAIGRPLPGRTNIAISARVDWHPDGVLVAHSMADALAQAEQVATASGAQEIMIIGGETIYRAALPHADRLYLTQIAATVTGDAMFPAIDARQWRETERQADMTSANGLGYRFITLDRIAADSVGADQATP